MTIGQNKFIPLSGIDMPTIVYMTKRSFTRDFILVCSIGLNIGFIIGILMYT